MIGDIADKALVDKLFAEYHFDIVVNMAAQAGVCYSSDNHDAYIQSNIIGFYNILEACRHFYDLITGEDPQSPEIPVKVGMRNTRATIVYNL